MLFKSEQCVEFEPCQWVSPELYWAMNPRPVTFPLLLNLIQILDGTVRLESIWLPQ